MKLPPAMTRHSMPALAVLALLLSAPFAFAQQPPDDEAHAEVRKDVVEAEKKPDPRESKVPGKQAKDRTKEQDKSNVSRDAKAERDKSDNSVAKKNDGDKKPTDK